MLLFATYGIGIRLFDRGTAFLAMVLLFIYPVVYGQSEMFMHDVPLSAMVWLALVSNGFGTPWYAAPIGFAIGFGMLTKFTYPLFVAAPLFALLRKWL
jgi:4-amino-4-deoxy-L-arabinose transferase-like glycosyltransferase